MNGAWRVRIITRALPAGEVRERYRQEFRAELHDLGRAARLRYTIGLIGAALALRAAVAAPTPAGGAVGLIPEPRTPLRCRVNHRWRIRHNPDGEAYGHCDRCGKDRFDGLDRMTDTGKTSANLAANIIGRPN